MATAALAVASGVESLENKNHFWMGTFVQQFYQDCVKPGSVKGFGDVRQDNKGGLLATIKEKAVENKGQLGSTVILPTGKLRRYQEVWAEAVNGVDGRCQGPLNELAQYGGASNWSVVSDGVRSFACLENVRYDSIHEGRRKEENITAVGNEMGDTVKKERGCVLEQLRRQAVWARRFGFMQLAGQKLDVGTKGGKDFVEGTTLGGVVAEALKTAAHHSPGSAGARVGRRDRVYAGAGAATLCVRDNA